MSKLASKLDIDSESQFAMLTQQHRNFVLAYVENGGEAASAAIQAGYPEQRAAQTGYKLLKKPEILRAIQHLFSRDWDIRVAKVMEAQAFLTAVMRDDQQSMRHRLKAAEMLIKSQGGFIDKVQHVGAQVIRIVGDDPRIENDYIAAAIVDSVTT
jgi:phage terminase small subunit